MQVAADLNLYTERLYWSGGLTVLVCLLGTVLHTEPLAKVPASETIKLIKGVMAKKPLSALVRIVGPVWRTVTLFCALLAAVLLAARGR